MQTSISRGGVSVPRFAGRCGLLPDDVEGSGTSYLSSQSRNSALGHRSAKLAVLLNDAGRVTLFAGAGCANAHSEVLELANRLQAPIAYTFRGKEFLEHDNPNGTGMTGLLGTESGHYSRRRLT